MLYIYMLLYYLFIRWYYCGPLQEQLPIFLMFDVKQDTAFVNDTRKIF